jgi:hypothetical protein
VAFTTTRPVQVGPFQTIKWGQLRLAKSTGWPLNSLQIERPDWSLVIECTVPETLSKPFRKPFRNPWPRSIGGMVEPEYPTSFDKNEEFDGIPSKVPAYPVPG